MPDIQIPQRLFKLKWLAIANGTFGLLCIIFQIVLITLSPLYIASIGTGLWASAIFISTAVIVFLINKRGGSGWYFGLALSLAAMSALTGLLLLVLNISYFIPGRGLSASILNVGLIVMAILLAILGAVAAFVNILTCHTLIKTFIGTMDFSKPTSTP